MCKVILSRPGGLVQQSVSLQRLCSDLSRLSFLLCSERFGAATFQITFSSFRCAFCLCARLCKTHAFGRCWQNGGVCVKSAVATSSHEADRS